MTGTDRKQTRAYIDDLHHAFMARFHGERPGWGQFLDAPQGLVQIGRYGTSAGAVVLGLTGNQNSQTAQQVLPVLAKWVQADDSPHHVQTLPLAMLTIGIGHLRGNSAEVTAARDSLFQRQLPGKLWGEYWVDGNHHAAHPSVFVSAFVLIACYLTGGGSEPRVREAATTLEEHYLRDPDRYGESDPIISVAIVLILGRARSAVRADLKAFSLTPVSLGRRFNYFYDYQRPDGTWGREYFIVPPDLVAVLILHQRKAPGRAKLKARSIADVLMERLDAGGHLRLTEGDRLSTLEHGFAALALHAVQVDEERSSWFGPSWLFYQLMQERPSWKRVGARITLGAYAMLAANYIAAATLGMTFEGWYLVGMSASTFVLAIIQDPRDTIRAALGIKR